ncbi:hypothetical protein niasHS_014440 [Heterodera schachtii]|uniref:Serine/threonine-protein phosphatase n=1 Tax=Heterodera schachtii TaxID=97005 RepID=A0ABD2IBU3_HETSC
MSFAPLSPAQLLAQKVALTIIGTKSLSGITDTEVLQLTDYGKELFDTEPARVSVKAPCHIFGDIHGNLPGFLMFFTHAEVEQQLLQLQPPKWNLLVLGDFVDRGQFSLEVAALLVALKLLFPDKIVLVRGNHETMSTNTHYGFRKEVGRKRTNSAQEIYNAWNELFDKLPLCAVVSDTFLCMHGGLPRPGGWNFMMGNEFVKPANEGEIDNGGGNWAFCDILWADSSHDGHSLRLYKDEERPDKPDNAQEGNFGNYRFNRKCKVSIEYNDVFVQQFLDKFPHISGIFRAHEPQPNGYRINEAQTHMTLHSSIRYAEPSDCASIAQISADCQKIVIITLKPKGGTGGGGQQQQQTTTEEEQDEQQQGGSNGGTDGGGGGDDVEVDFTELSKNT